MKTMIGLPEAMADTFVADVPMPRTPYVDPVTREALDLLFECDRIDAMPGSEAQQVAMGSLLARVQELSRRCQDLCNALCWAMHWLC